MKTGKYPFRAWHLAKKKKKTIKLHMTALRVFSSEDLTFMLKVEKRKKWVKFNLLCLQSLHYFAKIHPTILHSDKTKQTKEHVLVYFSGCFPVKQRQLGEFT